MRQSEENVKKFFLLGLLNCILFVGCASLPNPSDKVTTLVYGNIICSFDNESNEKSAGNEEYDNSDTTVALQEVITKKAYIFDCNKAGEFYRTDIPEGYYRLVTVRKDNDDEIYEGTFIRAPDNYAFYIHDGYVNNLGQINFIIYRLDANHYDWGMKFGYGFDEAKSLFWKAHPDSLWCLEEWMDADQ